MSCVAIVAQGHSEGVVNFKTGAAVAALEDAERRATIALAGRAADELLSAGATANATSDLVRATRLVTAVHGDFGLRAGGSLSLVGSVDGHPRFARGAGSERASLSRWRSTGPGVQAQPVYLRGVRAGRRTERDPP